VQSLEGLAAILIRGLVRQEDVLPSASAYVAKLEDKLPAEYPLGGREVARSTLALTCRAYGWMLRDLLYRYKGE